ncbi:MAG: DUF6603 domain-containing protein, partial [Isosphaeraceae bacterium]
YAGAALIRTEALTLTALGAYAELNHHPSLFIYAVLDYPLGGPAFFFVTGLAAGFGYNRSLVVPPVDRVAEFPLVQAATSGKAPPADTNALSSELSNLERYVLPEVGEMFLAVGVKFTSFKMIDSFVLLAVAFGNELEIDVLGLSTVVVPTPIPNGNPVTPLAVIQLALKASFIPAHGFLGISAQLTSASFIFSRDCHLTGGFAFHTWFARDQHTGEDHTGDFVLTVGGYHPDYKAPAHYPTVPRLGLNWQVTPHLGIKGDAYFALCPTALMAGAHLQVLWQDGSLRAWFNSGADFIVSWQPYHYDARMHVDVGASYTFWFFGTQHITIDVGAELHLWGPDFSGTAHVNLEIIAFDLTFGAATTPEAMALTWGEFEKAFLPPRRGSTTEYDVCTVAVESGLLQKVVESQSTEFTHLGALNPKDLTIAIASVIPLTKASSAGSDYQNLVLLEASPVPFGVPSMHIGTGQVQSTMTISINRLTDQECAFVTGEFHCEAITKNLPAALWDDSFATKSNLDRLNSKSLIEKLVVGFRITPKDSTLPRIAQTVSPDSCPEEPPRECQLGTGETIPAARASSGTTLTNDVRETLTNPSTCERRLRVLKALGFRDDAFVLERRSAEDLAGGLLVPRTSP